MTSRIFRLLIAVLATTLAAATLGCGLVGKANDVVGTGQVLADFADRLGKATELTYTADYQVTGGGTVTLVQQPPSSAFLGKAGARFIFTADTLYLCGAKKGIVTCQKSPNDAASASASDAGFVAGVAGPGFITPEVALSLVVAAAFVPGATVQQSDKTIAGEKSLCATASGLAKLASPGESDPPRDFSVCVTEAGILASFSGTTSNGEMASIELTRYSTNVDPSAFVPPPAAKIVDVTQLEPIPKT